jgi:mercuric ion transport protein
MTVQETAFRPPASLSAPTLPRAASGWLAALGAGAGFTALIASSCCLVPLGLAALGAGAGVFGGLEWLASWRLPFLAVSALAILGGWGAWWRKRAQPCEPNSTCARPSRSRGTLLLLCGATLILLAAASWDMIEQSLLETRWFG